MAKKKIMVVEDEALTAMHLKTSLLELGYQVPAVAASGEEAVRQAAALRPDLILMDITLEGAMNGIQAALKITAARPVPIIYLTAHTDPETMRKAKRTEPFGYLPKPCRQNTLATTVEMALYKSEADRRRQVAELEREQLLTQLQEALAKVKLLSGLLSICAGCKNIVDEHGNWHPNEEYIMAHSEAEFSHSICPDCKSKLYPEHYPPNGGK